MKKNKLLKNLLILSAGCLLASCDPVKALPKNYNESIVVNNDGSELDISDNDLLQIYNLVEEGKIFVLENYNIGLSRYLISGVDVWLNNPRRPLEASGTSGQKAAVNGAINFSVLDGWWAEGYNQKNGWTIGSDEEFTSYEVQDNADSKSMYDTLENKIMPMYYRKNEEGY